MTKATSHFHSGTGGRRWLLGARLCAAALVVLASGAHAAPAGPSVPAGAERAHDKQNHERLRVEVLDQMRAMRMWRLTEELKLDQASAANVFPILAQYDEQAREIGRERRDIGREVVEQTRSGRPDDAKLKQLIDRLLVNQQRRHAIDEQRFKAVRSALTPLQQAKLLLLLPKLEDDFRRRIRDAMRGQRHGEGRREGHGEGRDDEEGLEQAGQPAGDKREGGRPLRGARPADRANDGR